MECWSWNGILSDTVQHRESAACTPHDFAAKAHWAKLCKICGFDYLEYLDAVDCACRLHVVSSTFIEARGRAGGRL